MTSLQRLLERLRGSATKRVTLQEDAFAFGFTASSGRVIPIVAQEMVDGSFLLSDAGETWSELVSEGFSDFRPSRADRHRLDELAKLRGVQWNHRHGAFEVHATMESAPEAVRRLLGATIALDSWKVWASPEPKTSSKVIIDEVVDLAPKEGLRPDRRWKVLGRSGHEWMAPVALNLDQHVAAVRFNSSMDTDAVLELCLGWLIDTRVPSVVVANDNVARKLDRAAELRPKAVRIVGRGGDASHSVLVGARELLGVGALG